MPQTGNVCTCCANLSRGGAEIAETSNNARHLCASAPPLIRGTCVAPANVKLDTGSDWNAAIIVQTRGGNAYFTIFTIAKDGQHPAVKVAGQGLAAKAHVGSLSVSFDGEKVVLEPDVTA